MKQLRVKWVLSDLTLGAVWDVDLLKNESLVRDVILVAQGEMALEEFLKQVCRNEMFMYLGIGTLNDKSSCMSSAYACVCNWKITFDGFKKRTCLSTLFAN